MKRGNKSSVKPVWRNGKPHHLGTDVKVKRRGIVPHFVNKS